MPSPVGVPDTRNCQSRLDPDAGVVRWEAWVGRYGGLPGAEWNVVAVWKGEVCFSHCFRVIHIFSDQNYHVVDTCHDTSCKVLCVKSRESQSKPFHVISIALVMVHLYAPTILSTPFGTSRPV